jgi:hypothetical protein
MPLKEGKSQKTFSSNVEELVHKFKQSGKIGKSTPSSKAKARKQAVAIAFDMKRKS